MGNAHHIPVSSILLDSKYATGTLINQRDNSVMNIGISVSPAPRRAPFMENIIEKTI